MCLDIRYEFLARVEIIYRPVVVAADLENVCPESEYPLTNLSNVSLFANRRSAQCEIVNMIKIVSCLLKLQDVTNILCQKTGALVLC